MRRAVSLTLTLLTGLYLPTGNAQPDRARVYPNEVPIEFKANDGQTTQAYQGYFLVPENRQRPDSRPIKIGYVRFASTRAAPGSPIVYLAGGPGGSGVATAKWRRFPLFMALREFGDVIALDQRGTGLSATAPECRSSQQLPHTERVTEAEITRRYRLAAQECARFWQDQGVDPLGYTSVQNAWDLEDLRQHLSAPKISLWGISYGSHLALTALNLFSDRLDKVIIAGAEGLDQTVKLPLATDAYFERVQAAIDQQPALQAAFPDIIPMMRRVHTRLEQEPLMLKVATDGGASYDFLFQRHHMRWLASMASADPNQTLGMLLQVYKTLDQDDTTFLTKVLQRGMLREEAIRFELMALAMDIASGISDQRLALVEQQAKQSLLGDMLNFPMPQLARAIAGLDLGDNFRTAKPSAVPTLLFTGTLDGRTYPEAQAQATKHLSQLTQVTVVNAGHNLFTASPEILNAMQAFMREQPISQTRVVLDLPTLQ